jgi:hypothetical protein
VVVGEVNDGSGRYQTIFGGKSYELFRLSADRRGAGGKQRPQILTAAPTSSHPSPSINTADNYYLLNPFKTRNRNLNHKHFEMGGADRAGMVDPTFSASSTH